jgi:hypothetical protein
MFIPHERLPPVLPHRPAIKILLHFTVAKQPPVGQGLLIMDDSLSHSDAPYGLGVDSASNINEYQVYFLGVKAAGA